MAVTTTSQWAADLLINYVTKEIQTLEPELQFARFGVQKDIPTGYHQLAFPQSNQIATSSVSSINQGQNPSSVTWGSTAYTAGVTQKGLLVQVTDILVRNSALEVVQNAVRQTKLALARAIDSYLQTVVEAGTVVKYSGGKASRAALGAGDIMTTGDLITAVKTLRAANVRPMMGQYYGCIIHPNVETDLMTNTSTGAWVDVGRYTSVNELLEGKMGSFRGARFLSSANIDTFSSTVTVYPTLFFGDEPWGWGYFQQPMPVITMTADSNNPLNLYSTIGAKAALGATLFEQARIVRVESAVSS